ncbi:MAG: hypothetical protein CL850_01720 [Crocinitomicaceae bacterium]|nr:hypothetical protein [Crocinitomicaceae bacterium]|tara:strand:+ start:451 stop:1002 length:552 start_codon:yes stop_codon:yes gene_type:complete
MSKNSLILIVTTLTIIISLTGCRLNGMSSSSSNTMATVNSFLRSDGSTMYFIQNLEWKSTTKSEAFTIDITIHTSKDRCDSSLCQFSWFSKSDTSIQTINLMPEIENINFWTGKLMYKKYNRRDIEYRFEMNLSTDELYSWLKQDGAKCQVMNQSWTLTKSGAKANTLALQRVFPNWSLACDT